MIKNSKIKIIIVLISLSLLSLNYKKPDVIIFNTDKVDLYNTKIINYKNKYKAYTIDDISYKLSNSLLTDLLLTFDTESNFVLRDDTGHYIIQNANYVFDEDGTGNGSAKFYKKDHRVEIVIGKNNWLSECDDLGSFTIEMKIKLSEYSDNGIIFSRLGYSKKKQGIEIVEDNGYIKIHLYKVFHDEKHYPVDVSLNSNKRLIKNKWYYLALSFDRISGKLDLIINGRYASTIFATKQNKPYVNVLKPYFNCNDLPLVTIGKNFFGNIDELRISSRTFENLNEITEIAKSKYKEIEYKDNTIKKVEGIITSPVYEFEDYGTMVTLFKWDEIIFKDTYVWMEFRISDKYFESNDKAPKWYRIENNQKNIYLMKVNNEFLRGKYYQWRAHLIPSPDGQKSPILYNIMIKYIEDYPPDPPLFLKVKNVGDKFIELQWIKNKEYDIGGYKIYYGLKSKEYIGVISFINNKPITNEMSKDNIIVVKIDNKVIQQNKMLDKKGFYKFPEIKNDVLYYFSITAYDNYKPFTKFNHESKFSNEVVARPNPGSDIK